MENDVTPQASAPKNEDKMGEITKDLGETFISEPNVITESDCKQSEEDNDNDSLNDDKAGDWDDDIDEIALKDAEISCTEEDRVRLRTEAECIKKQGNEQFKNLDFYNSAQSYTLALRTCPFSISGDRAILYSNRAVAKLKLGKIESAIDDCNKALELNPDYLKARQRRAQLLEQTEKLDEAFEDWKLVLEKDPSNQEANFAVRRLPDQINERNEKLKTEMMSKLKDLGNLFLRPFGLSTDNFQLQQDPNSGGYSVNFQQS